MSQRNLESYADCEHWFTTGRRGLGAWGEIRREGAEYVVRRNGTILLRIAPDNTWTWEADLWHVAPQTVNRYFPFWWWRIGKQLYRIATVPVRKTTGRCPVPTNSSIFFPGLQWNGEWINPITSLSSNPPGWRQAVRQYKQGLLARHRLGVFEGLCAEAGGHPAHRCGQLVRHSAFRSDTIYRIAQAVRNEEYTRDVLHLFMPIVYCRNPKWAQRWTPRQIEPRCAHPACGQAAFKNFFSTYSQILRHAFAQGEPHV
jgi:hypothetical protein